MTLIWRSSGEQRNFTVENVKEIAIILYKRGTLRGKTARETGGAAALFTSI